MNKTLRLVCLAFVVAALSGCAANRRLAQQMAHASASDRFRDFPAAERILSGFALDPGDSSCRVGDCVLYGAELQSNDGALVRYLLATVISEPLAPGTAVLIVPAEGAHQTDAAQPSTQPAPAGLVEVESPTGSGAPEKRTCPNWRGVAAYSTDGQAREDLLGDTPSRLVRVESYDAEAKKIAVDFAWVPELVIDGHLYTRACRFARVWEANNAQAHHVAALPPGVRSAGWALNRDWLAFVLSYAQLLWNTSCLRELLEPMYVRPSLLALITNPGVEIGLNMSAVPDASRSVTLAEGWDPRPAVWLPFEVKYGWEEALHCEMTAIPNRPPLQIGAGVVQFTVQRMRGAQRTLNVQILAARRGALPAQAAVSASRAELAHGD